MTILITSGIEFFSSYYIFSGLMKLIVHTRHLVIACVCIHGADVGRVGAASPVSIVAHVGLLVAAAIGTQVRDVAVVHDLLDEGGLVPHLGHLGQGGETLRQCASIALATRGRPVAWQQSL